ncbi:MAG TPA: hypothetical protein VFQ61_13680 [Polyangiaceae bacterium]|nr:hypothetical protein [Polyangiaceae bacterium]
MEVCFEELLIALADKLWKGVRNPRLEQRCIDAVAAALGQISMGRFHPAR